MQVCIQSLEGVISSKKGEATCYYTFYLLTEKQIDSMHCISVNSVIFRCLFAFNFAFINRCISHAYNMYKYLPELYFLHVFRDFY